MSIPVEYGDDGYPRDLTPEQRAFQRLYGPWDAFDPQQAREGFEPFGIPWWVAGGWSIQAFTGVARKHEDIDVAIFRRDLPALRVGVAGGFHVWAAGPQGLCPLDDRQMTMPEQADQVWLRAHALAPWRADVLLNPDQDGRWVFRRDRAHVADLADVTWTQDGVRYLNPEVTLAFKAKHTRPKDDEDFAATLPFLDSTQRAWLGDFLARTYPDHAWGSQV